MFLMGVYRQADFLPTGFFDDYTFFGRLVDERNIGFLFLIHGVILA